MKQTRKQEATKWLGYLRIHRRVHNSHYEGQLAALRREVTLGGFALEDIRTSEEELEEFRLNGCRASASEWLGKLRCWTHSRKNLLGWLRDEIAKAKGTFTLEDIGTSEAELARLVRV